MNQVRTPLRVTQWSLNRATEMSSSRCVFVSIAGSLLLTAAAPAQSPNCELLYVSFHQQTSPTAAPTATQHEGRAFITATDGAIFMPTLQLPSGQSRAFTSLGDGRYENLVTVSSTRASLMSSMPSGNYTFTWQGGSGTSSRVLTQPHAAGLWPAQVPTFTPATYTGLQGMDPAEPFTLTVNQFTPDGQANQRIGGYYITENNNGSEGTLVRNNLLLGPSSQVTTLELPPNALAPGRSYLITWIFAHDVNSPGSPGVTRTQFRNATRLAFTTASNCPGNQCGTSDYNGDGDAGTDQDIEAFFACIGGNCCAACFCQGSDFNGDGDAGTDQDIEAFFRVLGGSGC
ncbi:MAG TPA: hypothetical protein VD997_06950 [Phycisphaerales bacterium]|nr:hypothetical protein [Phycisphaerales bacterium]